MKKIKKGLTMVELMISLGVFTIILTSIYSFYTSTTKINNHISKMNNLREITSNIQRTMTTDIRKGNKIIDSIYVPASNSYEFPQAYLEVYNFYFKTQNMRPLICIESISGGKIFYALNSAKDKLMRIYIEPGSDMTYVYKYRPRLLNYTDSNKGSDWYVSYGSDPNYTNAITGSVDYAGLSIVTRRYGIRYTFNNFIKIGLYETIFGDTLLLKNSFNVNGDVPYISVIMQREIVTVDSSVAKNTELGKYIVFDGSNEGITLTRNSTNATSMDGHYEIKVCLENENQKIEQKFIVSMVDYGGDIN